MAIWKVGSDGKAPSEATPGDHVVTAGGTYKIGKDGKGVLIEGSPTTANYTGKYANASSVGSGASAPSGSGSSGGGSSGGGSSGGGSSGGSSSTPAAQQSPSPVVATEGANAQGYGDYVVTTPNGGNVIQKLISGELTSYTSHDGGSDDPASDRTWYKGADGQLYVTSAKYGTQRIVDNTQRAPDESDMTVQHVDTSGLRNTLNQQTELAKQQARLQAQYAVDTGVRELQYAQEQALPQFQTQRNQIDIDEARARDNQALYAEARGDRGGIGAAQYDAIANTAATNRMTVNQAQIQLATDTARDIANLRAQGEFQTADALLTLTQNYLSQLMSLEQWGIETNLSVDEFNVGVKQWLESFELEASQVTGYYKGQKTYAMQKDERQQMASVAAAMLDEGMEVSDEMLRSLGFSTGQVADGTARSWATTYLKNQSKTEAQSRIDTALKNGAQIYEIPDDVKAASGYADWELAAMGRANAQAQVATELSFGKKVSDLSPQLKAASGYSDSDLLLIAAGSSGSSTGLYRSSSEKPQQAWTDLSGLYYQARKNGGSQYIIDNAKAFGVDSDELSAVVSEYQNWNTTYNNVMAEARSADDADAVLQKYMNDGWITTPMYTYMSAELGEKNTAVTDRFTARYTSSYTFTPTTGTKR